MTRLYSQSEYHIIKKRFFPEDISQGFPGVIVGNGPSSGVPFDLPSNAKVFRMNFFFLQDKPVFGNVVDGYFFSVNKPIMIQGLVELIEKKDYVVKNFLSPLTLQDVEAPEFANRIPIVDHWSILAMNPYFARFMMSRPFPTQGFQALGTLLILGFKEIYITGIDLYADPQARYSYSFPKEITDVIGTDHVIGGFEEKAHNKSIDIQFAEMCKSLYPDVKFHIMNGNKELERIFHDD